MGSEYADTQPRLTSQKDEASPAWDESIETLVQRARADDRSAFADIYERMYPSVARYLYYKVGDPHEAEDLASEVFLQAFRQLSRFRGGYFPGWIFRIARNLAAGRVRELSKRRLAPIQDAEDLETDGPDVAVLKDADHATLHRALSRLNPAHREVVVLKFLLGLANRDVGKMLRKSENAVNARQHRALRSLRQVLEAEGVTGA